MTATGPLAVLFHFSYLLSAVLFIVGLKFLSHPQRARRGNQLAALWGQHLPRSVLLPLVKRIWPVS